MELAAIASSNDNTSQPKADQVEITYYTDPLCCWSWAIEPQWRRLLFEFEGRISCKYIMGGLLPDWKTYNDELNSVSRPIQMGPVWMQANHMSGMPVPNKIWMHDPPASSYPACIAVKCAQLQSAKAGERYLRRVREAIMLHEQNIAKENVLVSVAEELEREMPGEFNSMIFQQDLKNDRGIEAFRSDLQQVQSRNINRFPTFIFRYANNPALIMTGYRPYVVLLSTLQQIAPSITSTQIFSNAEAYKHYWGSITGREIEEAMNNNPST